MYTCIVYYMVFISYDILQCDMIWYNMIYNISSALGCLLAPEQW